ncbi:hypothetical protein V8E53_014390, partial [Lactarius tabidus]
MTTTSASILPRILWRTLYQSKSKQHEQKFAEERIHAHYEIRKLANRGVEEAEVRDTPWHSESGLASTGGHLTVDFYAPTNGNTPVITHHVYKTDAAYGVKLLSMHPTSHSFTSHSFTVNIYLLSSFDAGRGHLGSVCTKHLSKPSDFIHICVATDARALSALSMYFEPPESGLLNRPPRDVRTDCLANFCLLHTSSDKLSDLPSVYTGHFDNMHSMYSTSRWAK